MIVALFIYIPLILNPDCSSGPDYGSPFSGKWKFAFTYSSGSTFANKEINVQYDGSFCEMLKVSDTGEEFFVKGFLGSSGSSNSQSEVHGNFSDSCNSFSFEQELKGSVSLILGVGYASGSFSGTQRNPNYTGTWQAKRN